MGWSAPGAFPRGSQVQVWSNSQSTWLDALVVDTLDTPGMIAGYQMPAGSLKIKSAAGEKWVMPEQMASMLRAATSAQGPPVASVQNHEGRPPYELSTPRVNLQHSPLDFVKGETVQVWSNSKGTWLVGSVEDVAQTEGVIDGHLIPVGAVRTTTTAGSKWVMPNQFDSMLRRCDAHSPASAGSTTLPPAFEDVRGVPEAPPVSSHLGPQDLILGQQVVELAKAGQWVDVFTQVAARPWLSDELKKHGFNVCAPERQSGGGIVSSVNVYQGS